MYFSISQSKAIALYENLVLFQCWFKPQIVLLRFKMEIAHFLSIIDSFCIVNVLYSELSDGTLLQQNKRVPVTAHKKPEMELLNFIFHHDIHELDLPLHSSGHCKSNCTVFILLLDVKQGKPFTKRNANSSKYINDFSLLRSPRRSYYGVFFDPESFLAIASKASLLCVTTWCGFPDNLIFFIHGSYHSTINTMCVMPKSFLLRSLYKFGKDDFDLPNRMKCMPIQNTAKRLDDLFTERVNLWETHTLLHPSDNHLLSNPAKALQQFDLKVLLRRLRISNVSVFIRPEFPWDLELIPWYIILHLLALSNTTGTRNRYEDRVKFMLCNGPLMSETADKLSRVDFQITGTMEMEAITCYTQPLLSFHIYSSPFLFNLWISISLVVVFLSVFLNIYIYFFHRKCSSSISSTLFSVSLLANVSYYVPKSVWDSNVFICACTPWILTTMILSNCYQSLVISEVNAPMRGKEMESVSKYTICENKSSLLLDPPVEYIKATKKIVRKLEIYTKLDETSKISVKNYYKRVHEERVKYQLPNCFSLLSEPFKLMQGGNHGFISSPYYYTLLVFAKRESSMIDFSEESHAWDDLKFHALHLQLRLYPLDPNFGPSDGVVLEREAAIEKELIKCEKSVYLASKETIETEISYLQTNYDRVRFYRINQDFVDPSLNNWVCSYHKSSKMPTLLRGFFESGIIAKLNYFETYTKTLMRRKGTAILRSRKLRVEPIKLSDSIHTVFILYGALISVSALGLLLELYVSALKRKIVSKILNIQISMFMREISYTTLIDNNFVMSSLMKPSPNSLMK